MTNKLDLKKALHLACLDNLQKRYDTIEASLKSIEESRNNETKSSAGDKHNTARAMMQIEENKAKRQLSETILAMQELKQIDTDKKYDTAISGSLISTNKGEYYISIGIGKITIDKVLYYCISKNAPIGIKLIGKKAGGEIEFNGSRILITGIS